MGEEDLGRLLPRASTAAMTARFVPSADKLQRLLINILDASVREGQAGPGGPGQAMLGSSSVAGPEPAVSAQCCHSELTSTS